MCLSKGLTGGFLPLSASTDSRIGFTKTFYHDYDQMKAFMHSHSYTGNALCCTAALATLDLFEQTDVLKEKPRAFCAHARRRGRTGRPPQTSSIFASTG